ncbi:MAG: hypothetical protein ACTSUO_09855 [Candidatus Thorarchaeota archaeon]
MASSKNHRGPMDVWCPIIPFDQLRHIEGDDEEFVRINSEYAEWKAIMRTKSMVGATTGIMLDRIRMMLMGVGVACAQNRDLATTVQGILADGLRVNARRIIDDMPPERVDVTTKAVLISFFERLKFTRDIIPEDDMKGAASTAKVMESISKSGSSGGILKVFFRKKETRIETPVSVDDALIKKALLETTNVLKRIYMRIMSPDPWGELE